MRLDESDGSVQAYQAYVLLVSVVCLCITIIGECIICTVQEVQYTGTVAVHKGPKST